MPRLRSILALLVVVSALLLPQPASVAAQNDAPALGAAVRYVDAEGAARGSITVTHITDPFEQYDPNYPPEAGSRVVAVTVAVDADAGDRFEVTPWSIVLQDSDGFIWNQGSVFFADDLLIPALTSQTLAPGSRITGIVGFVLPDAAEPARIFYQPESSRLITLAELSADPPPTLGDTVDLVDANGGTGTVTVSELLDPFTAFDPAYPPEAGARFVAFTLVYENTGSRRFDIEPYGLLLRDADGYLWNPASLFRLAEEVVIPDLRGDQLAPGDRRSGLIAFAVPEGVGLAGLHLRPASGQMLPLAALGEADEQPQAKPGVATPAAAVDDSEVSGADPCPVFATWLTATRVRVAQASAMGVESGTASDSIAIVDQVKAFAALADDQGVPAPPEAAAVNKALVATFRAFGAALEQPEPAKWLDAAAARLAEIDAELGRIALDCGLT